MEAMEAMRSAQEVAYQSMTEAHDRIMPMMGQVTAAQRAIKERLDDESLNDDREDLYTAAFEELEDAEDGMMDWMRSMKPLAELRETMNNEAIMKYIQEETGEIAQVETRIKSAVANAKQLVGDHSHDGHSHDHSGHDHDHNH